MSPGHVFHLSIPVSDLDAARRFYVEVLCATVGRQNDDWLDVLLWGHQVTLQLRPSEVLPARQQGKRHFGVTLPWGDWEAAAERVRASGAAFLAEPHVFDAGTPDEHAKFYLADPSHNVVEVKAYRDAQAVLHLPAAQETFAHRAIANAGFEDVSLRGARFDDVDLRDAAFANVTLAGATFRDADFSDVAIDDATLDGMRIDGVLVTELFAAWRRRKADAS